MDGRAGHQVNTVSGSSCLTPPSNCKQNTEVKSFFLFWSWGIVFLIPALWGYCTGVIYAVIKSAEYSKVPKCLLKWYLKDESLRSCIPRHWLPLLPTWCLSHSMALSQTGVSWSQHGLFQCTALYFMLISETLNQEDRMGQSIPLLNSTLEIIALGRHSRTDKGNVVFWGLQVPAPWALSVFDLAFVCCDSFPVASGKCALYQHFRGSIAQC